MRWLWLLLGIIPIIMAILKSRRNREVQHDLQFWKADSGPVDDDLDNYALTVHFPSMLLRWQQGNHALQVLHVRRSTNAKWEYKPTDRTNRIDLKRAKLWLADEERRYKDEPENPNAIISPKGEVEIAQNSCKLIESRIQNNIWLSHDLLDASLETAYQKYIHTRNTPITKTDWLEEEAKLEEHFDTLLRKSSKQID